jgi:hypothetical protein
MRFRFTIPVTVWELRTAATHKKNDVGITKRAIFEVENGGATRHYPSYTHNSEGVVDNRVNP